MSALAVADRSAGPEVLADYDAHVAGLGLGPDGTRWRHKQARLFLAAHPDPGAWMARPVEARLVELARTKTWPLITWAILTGRVTPDLDLLLSRRLGGLHRAAAAMYPDDYTAISIAAQRLGWQPRWAEHVAVYPLTLAVAWTGRSPVRLTDADIDALAAAVDASPAVSAARRVRHRRDLGRLRQVLFEARILQRPTPRTRAGARGVSGYFDGVTAPEIHRVMLAYIDARRPVLRPGSLTGTANDLACFGEFLTDRYPELGGIADLERHHIEAFCQWAPTRPYRGNKNRDRQVGASAAAHSIITLRIFLDDITAWGWAAAPARRLVFASDIPRQAKPLPRALAPDVDTAVMAAVAGLDDRFSRVGLTVIRGTGLRAGELVDLELNCVVDYGPAGTWLQVPLGKLATERAVPLDDHTLAALDEWISERGPQRAINHPRHGRPADFLFVEHGRQVGTPRLRRGLAQAVRDAGLTGPGGGPLRVTPHQLRHTYATTLANAGMSLQALMALLGHASPDMTLRYASLASPTIKAAYDQAIGKLQRSIPVAPAGQTATPDRVSWLRSEMLKTRVAHRYCARDLVADACPYANICEGCSNFITAPEFTPALQAQLDDVRILHQDAETRGWESEAARHARVIDSLETHLRRLKNSG